jgi:hypothetical protein
MSKKVKNPAAVALGKLGGAAGTGSAKARTTEQAKAAGIKGAAVRWKNHAKP